MALIPVHCWNIYTFYVINTQQMISNLAFLCNYLKSEKTNQTKRIKTKSRTKPIPENIKYHIYYI